MSKIVFDHWENAVYGDPRTHYTSTKIGPKVERTTNLVSIVERLFPAIQNICEFGCNNGRNLYPFYSSGVQTYGFDICDASLSVPRSKMPRSHDNFVKMDLFNHSDELRSVGSDFFDLSFTMGFLMHLPQRDEKKKLIDQIIRTSKNILIYEPFGGEFKNDIDDGDRGWHLCLEDYSRYDPRLTILGQNHKASANKDMKIWLCRK